MDDLLTAALVRGVIDSSILPLLVWSTLALAATIRYFRWE
jgi:hypothetical protein